MTLPINPERTDEPERPPHPTIVELRADQCRYPLGEMYDKPVYFCGEPTVLGRSWCQRHLKVIRGGVPLHKL